MIAKFVSGNWLATVFIASAHQEADADHEVVLLLGQTSRGSGT